MYLNRKIRLYILGTFITACGLVLIYMYKMDMHFPGNSSFEPVQRKGVFTFYNVCIEINPLVETSTDRLAFPYSITRRVVIYNSQTDGVNMKLQVGASRNVAKINRNWPLTFKNQSIPEGHQTVPRTAYFIIPSCPANFHHFWEDEYTMLYSVIWHTKQLWRGAQNQIIYRYPWRLDSLWLHCNDVRTFEYFLKLLEAFEIHEWYSDLPPNICFPRAVFGLAQLNTTGMLPVLEYVVDKAGINKSECPIGAITIIQRTYRSFLNTGAIVNSLKKAGFDHVQVVAFENITVEQQLKFSACSSVLIGAQGAGLQWAMFMQPGSVMVEVGWKNWHFVYKRLAIKHKLKYMSFKAKTVHINWKSYEVKVQRGKQVSDEEREVVLRSKPKHKDYDNIWKWADVTIDGDMLAEKLKQLVKI